MLDFDGLVDGKTEGTAVGAEVGGGTFFPTAPTMKTNGLLPEFAVNIDTLISPES